MKKRITMLLALMLVMTGVLMVGCASSTESTETAVDSTEEVTSEDSNSTGLPDSDADHPVVTMEIANMGTIEIELYPEVAPNSVNNFIALVNDGYYDGLIFHRVINGFMIQGGDPDGTGGGGPGYSIKGEFSKNGFENNLKHTPGVLSMARANNPDSAGSQFFLMHKDSPHLDGSYAAFGQVITGMDLVDQIALVETEAGDRPVENVVMEKVTVELNGYEAVAPEKVQ